MIRENIVIAKERENKIKIEEESGSSSIGSEKYLIAYIVVVLDSKEKIKDNKE